MKNPKLISKPFAQNGQKNVIPEKYETSMESNQATWDQGFGQITMLPVSAGGLPPKGQDFNGILNQMCETIVHISKGGVFKFSADYAAAINGYPKGAILQSEDEKKYYQSLIDNNKVNFNTASQDQVKASWKLVMTDDLLDQLSKKLESSAVVQSTGTSTTSVMSQKASTDTFQPKGNYADKSSSNDQIFTGSVSSLLNISSSSTNSTLALDTTKTYPRLSHRVASGSWREIKIPDRSGEMSLVGDSYTKAESDGRYQSKGDYAIAGSSYTKAESDGRYQSKGNYQPAGNYALVGASYTKAESDNKYQPKGNYADKSSSNDQNFNSSVSSLLNISSSSATSTLALDTTKAYPRLSHRVASGSWREIKIPDRSGEMSLVGDSYTKAESDGRYQSKGNYQPEGNYGLKNTALKSQNGWWKCGDTGLIYQWGRKDITYDDFLIDLPIAFPSTICSVSIIDHDGAKTVGINLSKSTLSKIATEMTASNIRIMWLAVGY